MKLLCGFYDILSIASSKKYSRAHIIRDRKENNLMDPIDATFCTLYIDLSSYLYVCL